MIKGVIFDYNRTLYDPEKKTLVGGTMPLLNALRYQSYKLCLLSRGVMENRQEEISGLGLDQYFQHTIVAEEKTKEHFKECLKIMEIQHWETAVVGDRVRTEIYLGNCLGMRTIWLKSGKFALEEPQREEEKPDFTIKTLAEVLSCLS